MPTTIELIEQLRTLLNGLGDELCPIADTVLHRHKDVALQRAAADIDEELKNCVRSYFGAPRSSLRRYHLLSAASRIFALLVIDEARRGSDTVEAELRPNG